MGRLVFFGLGALLVTVTAVGALVVWITYPDGGTAQPGQTAPCDLNEAVSDLTNDLPPDTCVSAIDSSSDAGTGFLLFGTEDGRIGFVSGGDLTISDVEGTSGPIEALFLDAVGGDQGTDRIGAAFLSPEGVGAYSIEKQQRVSFQVRVDIKPGSQAEEFAANLLNDGFVTLPVTLTLDGLIRESNSMPVWPFATSMGSECLGYQRPEGGRSPVHWCTPSLSLFE